MHPVRLPDRQGSTLCAGPSLADSDALLERLGTGFLSAGSSLELICGNTVLLRVPLLRVQNRPCHEAGRISQRASCWVGLMGRRLTAQG